MDKLLDDVARILASPLDRRRAMRMLGGALTAAVVGALGSTSLSAAKCTTAQTNGGMFTCGNGAANQICCPAGTCCASHGNAAACCTKGQCTCTNGTCASSSGGVCPFNCTKC